MTALEEKALKQAKLECVEAQNSLINTKLNMDESIETYNKIASIASWIDVILQSKDKK
jgi:hypothetical protein